MPGPLAQAILNCSLLLSLVGCSPSADEGPRTRDTIRMVDASGRIVGLPAPATRVVSLVPSATVTLKELGAHRALVGRTDYDTASWVADVPSVGGGLQPNIEALIALEPDLVVVFGGEQDPDTPERLNALGIPWIAVRPVLIEDVLVMIGLLGRATGHGERSAELIGEIRAGLSRLEADRPADRVRVAYVLGGSPPWVAGPNTYFDELIDLAGGENVFHDLTAPYASVSPEELLSRRIDVVLVSSPSSFERRLAPSARVEVVGGDIDLPGPGLVQVAGDMAEAIRERDR